MPSKCHLNKKLKNVIIVSLVVCLAFIVFLALIAACAAIYTSLPNFFKSANYWEFEKDISEVEDISVIEISESNGQGEWGEGLKGTVLKKIDPSNYDDVFETIENVEMYSYYIGLSHPSGIGILIRFNNGDYDIISNREPRHYRYSEEYDEILAYNSHLTCNDEQFEAMVNKFLEDNE